MKSKLNLFVAAGTLMLALGSAYASQDHAQHVAGAAAASTAMTAGEVRKVDADQGKVTLKHEPIANLDMPAMTMVFRVAQPELLKDLKAGDKVQFRAESVGGALVVTQLQK
jgi:Cu(I)/Ag(I) efflux system periplasmic protein CusF